MAAAETIEGNPMQGMIFYLSLAIFATSPAWLMAIYLLTHN